MSKWRDTYKVHPSSDCFPVMSEDELDALAVEDPVDPRGLSEDEGVNTPSCLGLYVRCGAARRS